MCVILLALDEEACLCVLEAWIAHVQEQARVSGICQRILRRMSNGLLARSMAAWGELAFELLESDIPGGSVGTDAQRLRRHET